MLPAGDHASPVISLQRRFSSYIRRSARSSTCSTAVSAPGMKSAMPLARETYFVVPPIIQFRLVRDIEQFHAVTARSAAHSSAFAPFCEYSTIPRLLLSWVSGLSGFLCANIIFSLLQQLFSAFPAGPARLDFSQRIW